MDRRLVEGVPITASNLVLVRNGRRILDGATFTLWPRRKTVLMGANGAGKSLSLRILQGIERPTEGRIEHTGTDISRALVLQQPVLLARSTRANLLHALSIYGVPRRERADRADELLHLARLEHRADTLAPSLSGGERQRLAIARAIGARPQLLMLDEPTAQLDPESTNHVEKLVNEIHANGTRILMVTHDIGQAKRLADEIIFLDHGRVTESDAASSFFASPQSAAARAYLSGRLYIPDQ